MRKWIEMIGIPILIIICCWLWKGYKDNLEQKEIYRKNMEIALGDMQTYKTKDSLNVVTLTDMALTLKEYKRIRSEDIKLIESLKVDKSRLQSITDMQTRTINDLKGHVKDSIVYRDNYIVDTLRCVNISDKWYDFIGCVDKYDSFTGKYENRDSFKIIDHIIPKRFLFIKWGVKESRKEIIPLNPHTKVLGAEWITIRQ